MPKICFICGGNKFHADGYCIGCNERNIAEKKASDERLQRGFDDIHRGYHDVYPEYWPHP